MHDISGEPAADLQGSAVRDRKSEDHITDKGLQAPDSRIMNTSNNNLTDYLKEIIGEIIYRIRENRRVVIPVVAALCILIIAIVAIRSSGKKNALDAAAGSDDTSYSSSVAAGLLVDVPEVQLMKNAYPSVNSLIEKYYDAMASGDMDTILKINNNVDETEKLRLEKMSDYIDKYENIDVYTKRGPVANSYIAYVYAEVKFKDYGEALPGMQVYYVCTGEDGTLYINEQEQEENITNYIREVSLQSDVVDLNNKVSVAYNDMLSADPDVAAFLVQLTQDIDNAVGEELAAIEGTQNPDVEPVGETQEAAPAGDSAAAGGEGQAVAEAPAAAQEPAPAASSSTKVKTTTVVNVRSSDSETADKVGKAQKGEEFVLKEEKANGWSQIEYNGSTAYIKSDYLVKTGETVAQAQAAAAGNGDAGNDTAQTQTASTASSSSSSSSGKIMAAADSVNIRKGPGVDTEKAGKASKGEKFKVVENRSDGWTEIEYKGGKAYIRTDLLTEPR